MKDPCDFNALVHHAELYGCEDVYEVAETCDWEPLKLAQLAAQLRRIDRERKLVGKDEYRDAAGRTRSTERWRLAPDQRERLVEGLIKQGLADKRIRNLAGVGQDFIRGRREALESAGWTGFSAV